jgi:two-component system LytT family response regulator
VADRIRTLIVDDEPLARERIRDLLEIEPDIEVIGEASDGQAAVAAFRKLNPDLVFLDVQMPGLDGFEALADDDLPDTMCVIFVTAFDEYALRAFEARAADYILKPFDRDRFKAALDRARAIIAGRQRIDQKSQLVALVRQLRDAAADTDRILIKAKGRVYFLRTAQIDWLEAAGNYVRLHCGEETHLVRETLSELEARLSTDQFCRIHRGTIVNLDRILELQPLFHGEYAVILSDRTRLTLSRRYREHLQTRFGRFL